MPRRAPLFRPPAATVHRARLDDLRQSSTARGYGSAAWQRVRRAVIARDKGMCQAPGCGRLCVGPGEAHVDHIDPKRPGEPAEATPLDGLRLLCRECHSAIGRKYGRRPPDSPPS